MTRRHPEPAHERPRPRAPLRRAIAVVLAAGYVTAASGACKTIHAGRAAAGDRLTVAVTTEIIADLAARVGGDRIRVETIVPPGADPHSYEPTPSDAGKVAAADVAFTNHLLLEEHPLIKMFDANVRTGVPNVSLAEVSERHGAHLRPMVEDITLDTVWLGLAVRGRPAQSSGATRDAPARSADVRLRATGFEGPGEMVVYVTDSFGSPEVYVDTSDGLGDQDRAVLPPGAHTHVNWAFTEPGVYRLTIAASLEDRGATRELGAGTFTFAAGVDPGTAVPATGDRAPVIVREGHADVAVSLDDGKVFACTAPLSCADHVGDVDPAGAVVEVPNRALTTVPDDERFRFLGPPNRTIFQLPQAVLGKHVHGVVDPHLWEDVANAKAYVSVIADTLAGTDPDGRPVYESNRDAFLSELDELDRSVRDTIARIPQERRHLVTTHDAFGYLAEAYGLRVAGFVVPNPAQEPSALDVNRLTETIRNLAVPAVFAEPNLVHRAEVLRRVATDLGVRICKLYGDAFDPSVRSYVEMMRHNAHELRRCLGGDT